MVTCTILFFPAVWIAYEYLKLPWYAVIAFGIVNPLLAALIIFVPIMFVRQVIKSDKFTILTVCAVLAVFLMILGLIFWWHATGQIESLKSLEYRWIYVIAFFAGWWTCSRRRKVGAKRRQ